MNEVLEKFKWPVQTFIDKCTDTFATVKARMLLLRHRRFSGCKN